MKFALATLIMGISSAADCPAISVQKYAGGSSCAAGKEEGSAASYTPKAACTATTAAADK